MRAIRLLTVIAATLVPATSFACSIALPSSQETAERVGKVGMVIKGRVIQSFDADKQQPEIIRADTIFVGEGAPRDFVIYRSKRDFDTVKRRTNARRNPFPECPWLRTFQAGEMVERLVLTPADVSADAVANGRWVVPIEGDGVLLGVGLEAMLEQARRVDRFKERPPKSAHWSN